MVVNMFQSAYPSQRTNKVGRLAVYFLLACSCILMLKSYNLENIRLETLILNSFTTTNRLLPEEGLTGSGIDSIGNSEFYVPSLDYRIKGVSQYSSSGKNNFEAHVYCRGFEKDLLWEWWRPNHEYLQERNQRRRLRQKERRNEGITSHHQKHTTRKRLLIGISSGYDDRARLLERAVWSARIYGAIWSGDESGSTRDDMDVTVVTLQGTAFSPHGCKASSSHASIDKIRVLFQAIDSERRFDRLLLLDADAMIYGMDMDLTLLDDGNHDFVLMGPPILKENGKRDKNKPWEISSAMTYWNLENPLTRTVALDWFNYAKNAIIRGSYLNDQKYLHKTLQQFYSTNQDGIVKRNGDRFNGVLQVLADNKFDDDSRGTLVKQFTARKTMNVESERKITDIYDEQIERRLARMVETAKDICCNYPRACKKVGSHPTYEIM